MQCPDCQTFKKANNCQACFLRARKRLDLFPRALRRLARRYLRARAAHQMSRSELERILESTADHRLRDRIRDWHEESPWM